MEGAAPLHHYLLAWHTWRTLSLISSKKVTCLCFVLCIPLPFSKKHNAATLLDSEEPQQFQLNPRCASDWISTFQDSLACCWYHPNLSGPKTCKILCFALLLATLSRIIRHSASATFVFKIMKARLRENVEWSWLKISSLQIRTQPSLQSKGIELCGNGAHLLSS